MMVSSESQNDIDALSKKIDAALTFPNECLVVDVATKKSNSEFNTCEEFLEYLERRREFFVKNPVNFYFSNMYISSSLPFSEYIRKSKILEDCEIFNAIFFSKILEDVSEYARNRDQYQGEMVWVGMDLSNYYYKYDTALICGNEIIYAAEREILDAIRDRLKTCWLFFQKTVKKNLIESLSVPVSIPDPNVYLSDSQPSFDAAVSSNAASNKHQKMATITEDEKKIVLDELNSLNLDPRYKQQFESYLKLNADKDVNYWRERLDALRCSTAVSSAQTQELEQLRQKVAELEKMNASLLDGTHSASLSGMVSQLEKVGGQNESQPSTSSHESSKVQIDASFVKKSLIESLSVPASIPDPNVYLSDLQSSFDAAVSSNAPSNTHQKMATMTEETKKIVLDELNSLNLDPRFKQQFEFDLKLMSDKDMYYWRDRLDSHRFCSISAPVGSPQSPELEQLRQKVAELEKMNASLRDGTHSASLSGTVSKLEEVGSQNESRPSTLSDESSKVQIDASFIADCKNTSEETKKNAEKLRKLEEEFSISKRTVELNDILWKNLNKKVEELITSVNKKAQGTDSGEPENSAGRRSGFGDRWKSTSSRSGFGRNPRSSFGSSTDPCNWGAWN